MYHNFTGLRQTNGWLVYTNIWTHLSVFPNIHTFDCQSTLYARMQMQYYIVTRGAIAESKCL